MATEIEQVHITERTVLRKFEGDPEDGKLLETIEIEDGRIVKVTKE